MDPDPGQRAHEPGVTEGEDPPVGADEPVAACVGGVDDADDGEGRGDPRAGSVPKLLASPKAWTEPFWVTIQ